MNEVAIFSNDDFGEIRTVVIDGEVWFCLSDVCKSLGLTNVTEVKKRLNEKGVSIIETLTKGGTQNLLYVNEPNLYKIIFQSRKKEAEKFTDWVTGDVLPSIRKTGSYGQPQLNMTNDEKIQLLAVGHTEVVEKLNKVETEVDTIKATIDEVQNKMYILPIEADKISKAVKKRGVDVMGGKDSEAYRDKSLTKTVYRDIYSQIYREFGIKSYEELQRCQIDEAIQIIGEYKEPMVLKSRIDMANSQLRIVE